MTVIFRAAFSQRINQKAVFLPKGGVKRKDGLQCPVGNRGGNCGNIDREALRLRPPKSRATLRVHEAYFWPAHSTTGILALAR